ncbi:MAG TPA: glycoside hydrolase family 3 N-terminal domain-containing protein [Gelidibacter sp.]|uniref:glycoside hydrolase family 3 protein n=1 Tax=Gelidibacter sp. TaxID=2018083 RepID=UPI002B567522|nr:glycoside hydrolase family 3 N-terminal domain-containing protein [Gelidibacter sp.]HXJ99362.1 glycoside hydrolase family 3 N-terminal domain-containing protein [Gelidibacter sp.]
MKHILITAVTSAFILTSCGKATNKHAEIIDENRVEAIHIDHRAIWVDSIYNTMSLKEKVGQLFMVATYSNRTDAHTDTIEKLITDHHIGGLIFFQGGPVRQANMTNHFQSKSKVPLLIGFDGEWGLNMRLDSTARYPFNMTLGAIKDNHIINKIGRQIGEDCHRIGIHINFAPAVDINTNSANPVIGVRSFGEDKFNVTEKAIAFTEGMQSTGTLACAKHFPGHGDTHTDSHKTLPTVSFNEARMDSVELYPYKKLIRKNIAGVMVAHLNVPSLESQDNLPSSLSYAIITTLLKEKLEFENLIFTDALNMKGAANYKQPGDIDLAAFKAGNDVLLFTENAPKGILKIVEAYNNNEITEERLSHSVKKILSAKFDVGLNDYSPIVTDGLWENLNKKVNAELYEEAIASAITLIKNENEMMPLSNDKKENIAFLKLGNGSADNFLKALKENGNVTDLSHLSNQKLLEELKKYDRVIIGYHRQNARLTNAVSNADKKMIENISQNNKTILAVFASQYSLKETNLEAVESILISYENSDVANKISADIIFGEAEPKGSLPASISKSFPVNSSISFMK